MVKDASLVNEGGEEPAVVKKICLIENTSLLEELEFVEVVPGRVNVCKTTDEVLRLVD